MKRKLKPKIEANQTAGQSMTRKKADELFVSGLEEPPAGANSIVPKFLMVMNQIRETKGSFEIGDVLVYARPFELPVPEVQRLFGLWSQKMIDLGKLEELAGAYDTSIFINLN